MKNLFISIIFTPLLTNAAEESFLTHNIDFGLVITSIESKGLRNSVSSSTNVAGWKKKDSWKLVKKGASFEEVRKFLGESTKIETVTPNVVTWYYSGSLDSDYPSVSGHVFFGSRTVSFKNEPEW